MGAKAHRPKPFSRAEHAATGKLLTRIRGELLDVASKVAKAYGQSDVSRYASRAVESLDWLRSTLDDRAGDDLLSHFSHALYYPTEAVEP